MASPNQEEDLRSLARAVEPILAQIYGKKMAFFLCVSEFGNEGVADFIGNAQRESSIEMMQETVNRLKANQDIPASQGNG